MVKTLSVIGLLTDLIGVLCLARGLFVTRQTALELGQSRLSGNTDEEKLRLPAVQDRIKTRNWAVPGAVLLVVGFTLQILAVLLQ
jgi:hypothetical protein